ncbi:MAG: hypothetical protein COA33_004975 [Fluviicola sp.]|nr:hypothetical protein [Fluviicola sp.]
MKYFAKGIKDLTEKKCYRSGHFQKEFIKRNIPGKWGGRSGIQNIYNLISGKVKPKDPAVYIILSQMLDYPLEGILLRFSECDVRLVSRPKSYLDDN